MTGDRTHADSAIPSSDLMHPGLQVGGDGRYELLSKLGEGGMGSVWRAKDRKLSREVAIKRIRGATTPALQERFLRETRALTGLSHPNVVTVFDAGEDSYGNYLVMELVSGKTLAQRLKEGPIDASQTVDLFSAMCKGMSHAHKRGVIHRDLKPSNVMLNDDGVARILDFGLARLQGISDLSLTGMGVGTLDYASPEQRQEAGAASERSDVYSLGLLLYEMLTGKRPVPMHLHKVQEPWRSLLERATEPDPEDRFASIDEMLSAADLGGAGSSRGGGGSLSAGKAGDLSCSNCRLVNFSDSRFCRQCGGALRVPCPACGKEIHTGPKHCDQCGADTRLVFKLDADCALASKLVDAAEFDEAAKLIEAIRRLGSSGNLGGGSDRIVKQIESVAGACKDKNHTLRYVTSLGGMGLEFCGARNRETSELRHLATGIRLVEIPSGFFDMGSMQGDKDEQPVHKVYIKRHFWMARTPVTQAQYAAVVGRNTSHFGVGDDAPNRPVEMVSWDDAVAFCEEMSRASIVLDGAKYGFRLPTEAEWEYCCRAGSKTAWSTGDSLVIGQANFVDSGFGRAVAVGSYPANAWGLCDMHGNVWEWCLDAWKQDANFGAAPVDDPCVTEGRYRILRGGGWGSGSNACRSSFRRGGLPDQAREGIGFRVVLAPILGQ